MPKRLRVETVKDLYACSCCNGTGKLELTGVYAETLQIMRANFNSRDAFAVANRDAHLFQCGPTALNNRLNRLEEMGFVDSERYGNQRRFYLTMVTGSPK